jgi:hypothetical protein
MALDGPDAPRPVSAHLLDETSGGATSSTHASVQVSNEIVSSLVACGVIADRLRVNARLGRDQG